MSEKRFHQFGLWVIDNPNFNGISIADLVDTELMSITEVVDLLNEQQATIQSLKEEKDSLVAVIDENLLKGYHEQSIKHKEAKDKMKEGESSEVSPILDVIFYWTGYIKALEELKEGVSDE